MLIRFAINSYIFLILSFSYDSLQRTMDIVPVRMALLDNFHFVLRWPKKSLTTLECFNMRTGKRVRYWKIVGDLPSYYGRDAQLSVSRDRVALLSLPITVVQLLPLQSLTASEAAKQHSEKERCSTM